MCIIFLLLFWGVYKTNSRGALLGLLTIITVFIYLTFGKIKTLFLLLITTPIVTIVIGMFRTIDAEEDSAGQRIEAWYTAIDLFKSHPFVGVGMGNFTDYHYITAHNSYALVLAELGFLGYTLWFVVSVFPLLKLYSIINDTLPISPEKEKEWLANRDEYKLGAKVLFLSLTGFLATGFFISRSYSIIWIFIVSLSIALTYLVENIFISKISQRKFNVNLIKKAIFCSVISMILLYFSIRLLL
nr:O-antigen ligase family protein [Colwellia maritima]